MFNNKSIDPKKDLPIQSYDIEAISCNEGSTFYENTYVSKSTFINQLVLDDFGMFVFGPATEQENLKNKAVEIQHFFEVSAKALFCFFFVEEKTYVVTPAGEKEEIHNVYTEYQNLYTNLARPDLDKRFLQINTLRSLLTSAEVPEEYQSDNADHGKTYIHDGVQYEIEESFVREDDGDYEYASVLIPSIEYDRIAQKALDEENNAFPLATTRVDQSGQEWILKDSSVKIKGFDTGLVGEKKWYKVSDKDPTQMMFLTAFGGCFGFHKLAVGNIIGFLWYFLTCGGIGILVILDILQFLFGSAGYNEITYEDTEQGTLERHKDKVFYKKIPHKAYVLVGLIISVIVCFIAIKLMYVPLYNWLTNTLMHTISGVDEQTLEQQVTIFDKIFNF